MAPTPNPLELFQYLFDRWEIAGRPWLGAITVLYSVDELTQC